jgi:hypothetical protein
MSTQQADAGPIIQPLDLRREYPRSPSALLGPYVILARTIDKCRADIAGMAGEYHWNCGLAEMFFEFKGIDPMAFHAVVAANTPDAGILKWVEDNGRDTTEEEILAWSYDCRTKRPEDQAAKAYVEGTLRALNRPVLTFSTYFEMLDAEEGRL